MNENKPALVLFHGWGFNPRIWDGLREDLEKVFILYTPNLPGHGGAVFQPYTEYFSNLTSQLPEQFYALGWSLGGLYALQCAALYPNRVKRILNVCSSPRFVANDEWPGIEPIVLERFYQRYQQDPNKCIRDFMVLQARPNRVKIAEIEMRRGYDLLPGLDILRKEDMRDALMDLPMPIFYLLGKRDSIVPKALATELGRSFPHIEIELWSRAAHMPFISEPTRFIQTITRVLSS